VNRYRTDRAWNINVNIVLADILSTAATALVIDVFQAGLPTRLAIVTATLIVDGAISLAAFAGLHTYTNRSRGVRDLLRVQLHRWALGPLHYVVGAGLQFMLLAAGVRAGLSVLLAYLSAVAFVRTVHTLYGKKSGLFH